MIAVAREAESVAADDDAVLQEDVVAQHAELTYHSVGVSEEAVADSCSAIDDDVRQQDGVVADFDIVLDYDIGADVSVRCRSSRSAQSRPWDGRLAAYAGVL